MVTDDLIGELKDLKGEIMKRFKGLLSEIEIVQDGQRVIKLFYILCYWFTL